MGDKCRDGSEDIPYSPPYSTLSILFPPAKFRDPIEAKVSPFIGLTLPLFSNHVVYS